MSSTIRVDVRQVEALADRLASVDARALGQASLSVVNEAAQRFEKQALDGGVANINLSRTYVKSKTDLALATNPVRPRAEIVTRGDLTVLGNFEPLAVVRAPGAQRRAGAIKGRRNAGTLVSLRRNETLKQDQWFILPLRRGEVPGGNGLGVFIRDDAIAPSPTAAREGKAGKRQIYGPSPYQLFRKQIDVQGPEWAEDLERSATARLVSEIERAVL